MSDVKIKEGALALLEQSGITVLTGEYRGWTHRMRVAGTTGNEYTVSMRVSDGVWGCSCPGWIFSRRCQHLDVMLPMLLQAFPESRESPPLARPTSVKQVAQPASPLRIPPPANETREARIARLVAEVTDPPPDRDVALHRAFGTVPRLPDPPPHGRPLNDAELKRKERIRKITSGEIYKKVAPGSAKQWANVAAAFTSGDVNFVEDARAYRPHVFKQRPQQSPTLATLFLEVMPDDLATLSRAYRQAVMRAFRDADFVDTSDRYVAAFARITTAFEALKRVRSW